MHHPNKIFKLSNYAKMIQLHNTYNKSAILFQKYLKCNFHHRHVIKNWRCAFKIAENSFTYLGVIITKNPRDLRVNWKKRIDQLKNNIDYWRTLPISMVGKINAVKMVSLPRFLHLFQSIP